VISSGGPFSASGQTLPMNIEVGKRIIKELDIPGARTASVCFRNFQWSSGGKETSILLVALDAKTYYEANSERRSPIPFLELFQAMSEEPGTAVVSNNFAEMHNYHTGDTITLPGAKGPVSLHIIGTIEDYSWNRGTVFVHQPFFVDTLDLRLVDLFHLYLPPGSSPEEVEAARDHLQKSSLGAEQALFALTRSEMREHILDMVRQLYGLAYRQLGVIGIVASLGVLSALMISVLQRQRELGLLRAVGASQMQVLRSVLAEAILMGGIGTLIGLIVGIPLQWYVVHVLLFEEAGFAFPVRIPWSAGGIIALLAMLAAFVAGVGPAIHAMRLRIAEAIAYE
jgi:putative ABC transport system permease protein